MADSQRVELLALRAQTEVLNGQIESYERETKELHDRLARDSAAAETASRKLAEERTKTGILGDRVGELERQLVAQSTEAGTLKEQVQQLINERTKLLREMETIKREWAATSEAERTENAVMREQISDVAAEVARLTSALEGPTSPIEAILADEVDCLPAPSNGSRNGEQLLTGIPEAAESSKGTLADRIRRLQSRTARVPQPSSA
jgi:chromosome segregation ATPase